ncbi:PA14 domain-containing protein [Vulcanisaeta sp. JCM 16161]|uniref:PA14 domain-containing protein n=1 Tax=Vulcanisaeta sp. JCM 16161 TaxID=1295372 RepID=UPI001FB1BAF8|nr:PA14 domain-containing protein [Vulcanisaeta sp. JCM 16161]
MVSSAYSWSSGAMFWQESYSGGTVTITMIGVYSNNGTPQTSPAYPYVGDGYVIYLFLKPTQWQISSSYNYSIPYVSSNIYTFAISPVQGDVMFPQSPSPYLVIEWNPLWQYAYTTSGAPGQWDVWIASNRKGSSANVGPSPSPNLGSPYSGWDGIGTGYFQPRPGDYICITVSYNPSTNTLTGTAYDLNTGQSASFTLSLNGYFTPPGSGTYVFGVAGTNGAGQANWGIIYVNYQS